jgi:epoxyqueuosine reductase
MLAKSETVWIEAHAKALGFDLCGVVSADKFPELAQTEEWLARGYAGAMKYLADPRRADPATTMPGIRSVIVCALSYNTGFPRSISRDERQRDGEPRGWISRYAWGDDYHHVLKERLDELAAAVRERFAEQACVRSYVDTGPVQERVLAKYAGLGWLGKNTLLLNQRIGSFFFLGVLLTDLDLAPSLAEAQLPPPDLCGTCRRCIDACPTEAFAEPYVLDARRCISYLTIELRDHIPEEFRELLGTHVFGCDICQDVCPWNRRAPVTLLDAFQPRCFPANDECADELVGAAGSEDQQGDNVPGENNREPESLFHPRLEWLASMSEEQHRTAFRGSPVKRTKYRGLIRNACIALGNAKLQSATPEYARIQSLLERLAASEDSMIAESARWALSRIQ